MRNLFPLCIPKIPCISLSSRKVVQIVEMDGKVAEFRSRLRVKDLLTNFNKGFVVKSWRNSPDHLPPSFELQLGKVYYLLPDDQAEEINPTASTVSAQVEPEPEPSVKRIKVVITKKQLMELLSKKISVEEIILGIDKTCSVSSDKDWKPSLVSIPEENDES